MQLAHSKLYKGRSGGDADLKMDQAAGAFYDLTDDEMVSGGQTIGCETESMIVNPMQQIVIVYEAIKRDGCSLQSEMKPALQSRGKTQNKNKKQERCAN